MMANFVRRYVALGWMRGIAALLQQRQVFATIEMGNYEFVLWLVSS